VLTLLPLGRHQVRVAVASFEPATPFVDVFQDRVAELALLPMHKSSARK
jgi:hypothetical protein